MNDNNTANNNNLISLPHFSHTKVMTMHATQFKEKGTKDIAKPLAVVLRYWTHTSNVATCLPQLGNLNTNKRLIYVTSLFTLQVVHLIDPTISSLDR